MNIADNLVGMLPQPLVYDVFMALGDYRFCISTAAYDTFRRESRWTWATLGRMGRVPARQYTGKGDDTITLEGTIYPHFRGGFRQIQAMRREADKGEPLLMVDSNGVVHGFWCITTVSETATPLTRGGMPLKQRFSLTLEYYGETYPDTDDAT
ncbi:phage tail protein [Pandoraea fibrosis]|uniref:Oxidoreductase n=1 Tax=Pandoraea fibrosis TaxID=1891094 RepID=A0A5E4XFM2_9BURK|nr:phage tail protein [Pandoraea fibrosis]VVE34985.1 oxidoreductase [Pandoraea fibrosis]